MSRSAVKAKKAQIIKQKRQLIHKQHLQTLLDTHLNPDLNHNLSHNLNRDLDISSDVSPSITPKGQPQGITPLQHLTPIIVNSLSTDSALKPRPVSQVVPISRTLAPAPLLPLPEVMPLMHPTDEDSVEPPSLQKLNSTLLTPHFLNPQHVPHYILEQIELIKSFSNSTPEYWMFQKSSPLKKWQQFLDFFAPIDNYQLQLPLFLKLFYFHFDGGFFSIGGKIDPSNHFEYKNAQAQSNHFLTLKFIQTLYKQLCEHYEYNSHEFPFLPVMMLSDQSYLMLSLDPSDGQIYHALSEQTQTWKPVYQSFFGLVSFYTYTHGTMKDPSRL